MIINNLNEFVKTQLEIDIGVYVLIELYVLYEYDIIDCFDVVREFVPNYIPSRECYLYSSF